MSAVAILRDYLEPTDTRDASETIFVDLLLEGWAKWAHDDGIDLRPQCFGDLWQTQLVIQPGDEIMRPIILRVSDDQFVLVDQRIARLPDRLRNIVFVEYKNVGPALLKAQQLGLNRLAYRQRLHAAQWALFTSLLPDIDNWRQGI